MARQANLPNWATAIAPGKVEIDAEKFYPEILEELWSDENWPSEVENTIYDGLERNVIDQYWLEVAFQIAKMDIQTAVSGTELAPPKKGALVILIKDGSKSSSPDGKSTYAQAGKPAGRGVDKATKGGEVRDHYKRIRAVLF